jgi:uracil-DNA glycosylase family protein
MPETGDASPFVPETTSLGALRGAAAECRGCHLHGPATQTVFGEGPRKARVMLVGEMPGDREDREGHPFVGPAGRELDEALADAGIDRDELYVTNVVKHFKFEERGKRRIHQTPKRWEVQACMPWLRAELAAVRPEVLVLLGATAGKALLGSGFKLGEARGTELNADLAPVVTATAHPSAILRMPDHDARERARAELRRDLAMVAEALRSASTG